MKTIIKTNPECRWGESLARHLATEGIPAGAVPIYEGRNMVYRLRWEGHEVCIKAFRRPGAINSVAYTTVRKSKAARSYLHAMQLEQLGIASPTPIAYVEERRGMRLGRSYYVCEYLEAANIRDWQKLADCEPMLEALAAEMVKMHRAGIWHKDFSPGNILFERLEGGGYRFYLVDINRMKFGVHDDRRLLQNFKCIHLDEGETERLARLYARASGRDEQETAEAACRQLAGYKARKQRLGALKRLWRGGKMQVWTPEEEAPGRGDVVVVVPIYKPTLGDNERISLDSITQELGSRRIVAVSPEGLDLTGILRDYPMLEVERFDPSMFDGIRGYNRLMTNPGFYGRFGKHEYMLVAQLDAFIFGDRLDHWCAQGYDYIGAPWLKRPLNRLWPVGWIKRMKDRQTVAKGGYSRVALYDKVGNGGLSLRRISRFEDASRRYAAELTELNRLGRKGFPEDVFWATRVEGFRYPDALEALRFAFDKYPRYSYRLMGRQLPMGCHAWYSRKMRRFWLPIIRGIARGSR